MARPNLFLCALSFATLLLAAPVRAQQGEAPNVEQGEPAQAADTPRSSAVADVAMAVRLAGYGERMADPVALIAAARILVMTESGRLDLQATTEGGTPLPDDKERAERIAPDPAALLAAAQDLAGGNAAIDQMVASLEQMLPDDRDGARGNVAGPAVTIARVQADATDRWEIGRFRAGERAQVIVDGDGDTNLDCYVYDEHQNLIGEDDDATDYCVLSWIPRYTGPFTLSVRNLGRVWNEYVLTTN